MYTSLVWLFVFRDEPVKFLVAKAEKEGPLSKAYQEARRVLRRNYNMQDLSEQQEIQTYDEVCEAVKNGEGGSSVNPGYYRALTDPEFRKATLCCIILAISNQMTGINSINIYATTIYQNLSGGSTEGGSTDGGISPRVGTVLNGLA